MRRWCLIAALSAAAACARDKEPQSNDDSQASGDGDGDSGDGDSGDGGDDDTGEPECEPIDPPQGVPTERTVWAREYDIAAVGYPLGVVVGDDGTLYVAGVEQDAPGEEDSARVFVIAHDPDGAVLWDVRIGEVQRGYGFEVALDDAYGLVLAGSYLPFDAQESHGWMALVRFDGSVAWEENFVPEDQDEWTGSRFSSLIVQGDGHAEAMGSHGYSDGEEDGSTWSSTNVWTRSLDNDGQLSRGIGASGRLAASPTRRFQVSYDRVADLPHVEAFSDDWSEALWEVDLDEDTTNPHSIGLLDDGLLATHARIGSGFPPPIGALLTKVSSTGEIDWTVEHHEDCLDLVYGTAAQRADEVVYVMRLTRRHIGDAVPLRTQIDAYDTDGSLLWSEQTAPPLADQSGPRGLAIAPGGDVYVLEWFRDYEYDVGDTDYYLTRIAADLP